MRPTSAAGRRGRRVPAAARFYLPDLVYGSNDGVITTFAVVCGVVGAQLSARIILILGFANLVADGFSMGASNFLARRSYAEARDRADRPTAAKHGVATLVGFLSAGMIPLAAYLAPIPDDVAVPRGGRPDRGHALRGRCLPLARDPAGLAQERRRDARRRRRRRRRRVRHRGRRRRADRVTERRTGTYTALRSLPPAGAAVPLMPIARGGGIVGSERSGR